MPYPNEHACRLHEPGLYEEESFRRIKRDTLVLIVGRRKGKETTEAQAYRYPVGDWEEAEARAHCKKAKGKFEAAGEEDKAMDGILELQDSDRVIVGDQVLSGEWVAMACKAEAERERVRQTRKAEDERSFSLDQRVSQVRTTWYAQFQSEVPGKQNELWVKEVLDDQVIVETGKGLYGYPYTIGQDGQITFTEPVKVEVVYRPVSGTEKGVGLGVEELVIGLGDEIKAVTSAAPGLVGGYLVRFGSPGERDLTGADYFAADTYYGPRDGDGADTLVHHGIALGKGLEGLAGRILAPIKTRRDAVGIWAETVLNLADQYEAVIYEMVQAGKLKWSSGTAARLARRDEKTGKISRWPIIEGSLTPTPMEPRLPAVMPLKAYLDALERTAESGGASAGALGLEVVKARVRVEMLLADVENTDLQD